MLGRFLRLWLVLTFAFVVLKLAFNLTFFGWIDMRPAGFLEMLVLPLGQCIVVWVVTRRQRRDPG